MRDPNQQASYASPPPPPPEKPRGRRGCYIWMVVLLAVGTCLGGGAAAAIVSIFSEAGEVELEVTLDPVRPTAGQPFTVAVEIENVDLDAITVTGVGLDRNLTDGLSVITVDPINRRIAQREYPLLNPWDEYLYNRHLAGGEKWTVVFTMQADQPGTYSGDVSVWIESEFMGITLAQARRASLTIQVQ